MEIFTALLVIAAFGTIIIFPIWFLVLLYKIKNNQHKIFNNLLSLAAKINNEKMDSPQKVESITHQDTITKIDQTQIATTQKNILETGFNEVKTDTKATLFPSTKEHYEKLKDIKSTPTQPPELAASPSIKEEQKKPSLTPSSPHKATSQETEFEKKAGEIISRIWSWIIVGEEHRPKNLSLEYAVASVWLLRASIVILLTGIGFFLKYSFDNNLIGPYGRVSIGIGIGLAMLASGVKLFGKKYHLIAQGLIGAGIATLYLSIFASYKIYKIIPDQNVAFAIMIFITVSAALIAVRLNSLLAAVFGIIGGYCTPVMLSTGTADLPGLFTYLLILGAGVVAISKYKEWKLLNGLGFVFTYGLYWVAIERFYSAKDFNTAVSFLSLFFLLFALIPVINNIFDRQKSNALTLVGMFFNALVYFPLSANLILKIYDRHRLAIVCVGLAVFYTSQIILFLWRRLVDKNLLIMLIAFASFFVTLTIPLTLSDEWITMSWSIQALIFLWISCRTGSNFIRLVAYSLYFIAFCHLSIFGLGKNFSIPQGASYFDQFLPRLMSFGAIIVSSALGYMLLRGSKNVDLGITPENDSSEFIPSSAMATIFAGLASALLFIYLHFEFRDLSSAFYPPCKMPLITIIWISSILICAYSYAKAQKTILISLCSLLCAGVCFKILIFDFPFWAISYDTFRFTVNSLAVESSMRSLNFLMITGSLGWAAAVISGKAKNIAGFFATMSIVVLFTYSTLELNTLLGYKAAQFRAGGISILWGLFAFSFVLSGIRKQIKSLRYTGLMLFTVVVLKVFLSDLSRLSQFYRIIAFIALGIVVLAASFIYIKFKSSFETGEKNETEPV